MPRNPDTEGGDPLELLRCSQINFESESTAAFVESIARQWDRGRVLTEKQYQALKRVHDEL